MKGSKRYICLILTLLLLFSAYGCGRKKLPEVEKLSELGDEELVDYLVALGLKIPEGCDVPEDNMKMIRHFVDELEKDPDWMYVTNMKWKHILFLRVKVVVSKFYENEEQAKAAQEMLSALGYQ